MRARRIGIVMAMAAAIAAGAVTPVAAAVDPGARLSAVTGTGLHNTYDRSHYAGLGTALDRLTETGDGGPALIELDVWTLWHRWIVKHDLPVLPAGSNNCTKGTSPNQDLATCLANLKAWSTAHPGHPLVVVKIELKNGFAASSGFGPVQLDALLRARLGALYRPVDLLTRPDGTRFADLDVASAADNWATLPALRGRFMVIVQTGTFEESNPVDTLKTDVEYSTYLRADPAAAAAFPVVKRNGATGDPRTRYAAALRPWFVSVDTDAAGFAALPAAQRSWYATRHLFVVDTDVYTIPPAIDQFTPTTAQATARVQLAACQQASIASADWATVPGWTRAYARGSC
jgi:Phosphoinositide phospholipase C, Ca2+-dependent